MAFMCKVQVEIQCCLSIADEASEICVLMWEKQGNCQSQYKTRSLQTHW